MNPKVDFYFNRTFKWQEETLQLRSILLECGLSEELKWGVPCYQFQENNIVLIHDFKDYCAILFFKGVLMSDPERILVQQTKNVQATRQVRFTNMQQIIGLKSTLTKYVFEAIEIQKAGIKIPLKKTEQFEIADEFQSKLNQMPQLKTSFYELTAGRQRAYLLYFSAPKQSKTRVSRIEKAIPSILKGKGLND